MSKNNTYQGYHKRRPQQVSPPARPSLDFPLFTWIPADILQSLGIKPEKKDAAFLMANGQTVTRNISFAILRVGDAFTTDEVVFAQPGDLCLLGSRALEGMNLRVDPRGKKLVAAGLLLAAGAS